MGQYFSFAFNKAPAVIPNAIDWPDFFNRSSDLSLSGISLPISVRFSAANVVGSPTLRVSVGYGSLFTIVPGSPVTLSVSSGEAIEFLVSGTENDSADITVSNQSNGGAVLDVVRGTVRSSYYFILTSGGQSGNLGGRHGADRYCLTDLVNNDWLGKAGIDLSTGNVRAFLCDSDGCANTRAATTYRFARAGSATAGGGTFLTNVSGQGPGNSTSWSGATAFSATVNMKTDRVAGAATLWGTTATGGGCDNWTEDLASISITNGYTPNTSSNRWNAGTGYCNSVTHRMICLVEDLAAVGDATPTALDWVDFSYRSNFLVVSGVDRPILLRVSASPTNGTPSYAFSKNNGPYIQFSEASWEEIGVRDGDSLSFQIDGNRDDAATFTIVNRSDGNAVLDTVAGTVQNKNFLILTNANYTGNLGGLVGAGSTCLSHLQAEDWKGKASVNLNGTTVSAFLCDSVTCNNFSANDIVTFATAGTLGLGGLDFTVNGSGLGPLNSKNWSRTGFFGLSATYWTGRSPGSSTVWSSTGSVAHCDDWTSTANTGTVGISANTSTGRWSSSAQSCGTTASLLCMVQD